MHNIAIFASGSGSNAENIFKHFADSTLARIALIVSDNPAAGVLERAHRLGVATAVIPRKDFARPALDLMRTYNIDYIVLAGFLSLVPSAVVEAFRGRIINIHPALLPAFGGKGMYGMRVHEAVIAAGVHESGITIHHVDEKFDNGSIIAQFHVTVSADDTPETLAAKIHELEYKHFPKTIEHEITVN